MRRRACVRDEEDVQRLEAERLHGEAVRIPELRAVVGEDGAESRVSADRRDHESDRDVVARCQDPCVSGILIPLKD